MSPKLEITFLAGVFAVALILLALVLTGCATVQQRAMIRSERVLEAGSDAWDNIVDQRIVECEAAPSPADCIEPTAKADDAVRVGVVAAVAALRAYWLGVAVGADPKDLQRHLAAFYKAVSTLPPEAFGGLLGGAR